MAGRSAASIQAEIDTIEAHLASADSLTAAAGSRSTNITNADRSKLAARLDQLYAQLGRADRTAPMIVRGVTKGLR